MDRRNFIALGAGAIATWPQLAWSQTLQMPVIGYLSGGTADFYVPFVAAFREGLKTTGFVEGHNLAIEYRWAEGQYDVLPKLANELVERKVKMIVASGGDLATRAARTATSTLPIVFNSGGDPVAAGFVASLSRPGGNLTGTSLFAVALNPKRIELLCEIVPSATTIILLVNPKSANTERVRVEAQEAAQAIRKQLIILDASTDTAIIEAFDKISNFKGAALAVDADPFLDSRAGQIARMATRQGIPAIGPWRNFAEAGGLITYGVSLKAIYRQLGVYAGSVLNGAKPADLPVQQPTTFEMFINARTATALGLTIPVTLLALADEVIE